MYVYVIIIIIIIITTRNANSSIHRGREAQPRRGDGARGGLGMQGPFI